MDELEVVIVPQLDKRLGRQMVHDPKSRNFPLLATVDRSTWRDKRIRVYDPLINPNQCHGECTGCANAMMHNTVGNRLAGKVLGIEYAHKVYSMATSLDPWEGTWPPDDTGSSGLAAAKAAQTLGIGEEYRHIFGGADEVVQSIQNGRAVSCGTWWYGDMFTQVKGIIEPTGSKVGGHQYLVRGYEKKRDLVLIRCWWGIFQDVFIKREHLNDLIMDGGDAHVQDRVGRH